jgi:signal transduction histidine kinase
MKTSATSLNTFFKQQAIRWAVVGFLVTLIFAIPCIMYSAKLASERQVLMMAKSAARAFRPMIIEEGNIRDAELKMQKALDLKPSESVVIRDPDLKAIYPLDERDNTPNCKGLNQFCWSHGFKTVSLLFPIYFDDQRQESLFGYLELSLKPALDISAIAILILILFAVFVGQAFGLSSALNDSSEKLMMQFSLWANYLKTSPHKRPQSLSSVPFLELRSMQTAVDGLHIEIDKLQAQLSLLREISHDLKTPHALLAKYFYLHLDSVEAFGKADPEMIQKIDSTLKRMGEILRQVRLIPSGSASRAITVSECCNLNLETKQVVSDLENLPEIAEKSVVVKLAQASTVNLKAAISQLGYYRILENLIRNAVEAVEPNSGKVSILVTEENGRPKLVIADNGSGIDPHIQGEIFDFDFTTKIGRGTGLGLGIVAKICEEFGAKISFTSKANHGTEFTVLFERAKSIESFAKLSGVLNA